MCLLLGGGVSSGFALKKDDCFFSKITCLMPKFSSVKVLCERCFTQVYATKFFIILVKGKKQFSRNVFNREPKTIAFKGVAEVLGV